MKIAAITLGMLRVPLRTPFRTALRCVDAIEDIAVMVHADNGQVGYGEAPATAVITGDTHASIVAAIRGHIAPRLLGADVADLNAITRAIQTALTGNPGAKAAVEIAIHDLWAQLHAAPLYRLLGGGTPRLTTDITISVDTIDRMVADSRAATARGFDVLKIKLGKDSARDIERVTAIHAAVAGRAMLRLDANQAWSPKQAVSILGAIERSGVRLDLVEQPVKANDIEGLKYVSERVSTPVAADESVFSPADALALIRLRAADVINIKLMKAGGISNALRIVDLAAASGIECMIGCMLESSVSVTAAAHLAIARSATITRVDLDGPALCSEQRIEGGATFAESSITVDDAPGLGIRAIRGLEPIE